MEQLRLPGAALAVLLLAGCQAVDPPPKACRADVATPDPAHATVGMVRLPGGRFTMGTAGMRPEEGPARDVTVGPFWIDRDEVTNAAFARFVDATSYVTVAERPLDPKRYPALSADQRRPASLVFVGSESGSSDPASWWRVIPGADWRHPKGPGSDLKGRETLPVVHIAWEDALAYAKWLGRDLPTEAEWEYAARGGLAGKTYVWGDKTAPGAPPKANTWQGVFPALDAGTDGYRAQPAPVGCFPANGYGLHDMAGNVWEWTRDWYRPGLEDAAALQQGGPPQARSLDPDEPGVAKHVVKGGSFLCADDYCFRYRPAARTPGPPDSGASHVGFRTVVRVKAWGGGDKGLER